MTDFRLKVFVCVAQHLSFTKAAQELLISQPAITKHIKELEMQYGVRLFERLGNTIALTPEGKQFHLLAEQILEDYHKMAFEMHMMQNSYKGELRLGASSTIAQYVLPPLLAKFCEKFPDVNISVQTGNSSVIESLLCDHRIDLGLVEGISKNATLSYETFMEDELVPIVSTKWKFDKEEISCAELCQLPLVIREQGSGTLEVIRQMLSDRGFKLSDLNVIMQLGGTESIKLFLDYAHALSILSIRSLSKDLMAGRFRIVELKDANITRQFHWVQRQGQENGLVSLFKQFVERYNREL